MDIDIEVVRAKEIDDIANIIGLTKEGRRRYRCPFCQSGTRSNASGFYVRGNTYVCYSCGASGDTINLVMEMGYNFKDAVEVIAGTGVSFKRKQKIELFLRCELPGVKIRGWKITPFHNDLLKHLAISNVSIHSLSLPISKKYKEDIRILFDGSCAFFPEEMSRVDDELWIDYFSEVETIYFFTRVWFALIKKTYYSFYDYTFLDNINDLRSRIRLDRSFFNEVFESMLDAYRVRPVQILAY